MSLSLTNKGFKLYFLRDIKMSVNAFGQASVAKTNAKVDTSTFLRVDGTRPMAGILDMGQNKIANIQAPSASGDVCTKSYADTKLSASGGTLNGNLDVATGYEITQSKAPSTANSLCNKTYVDKMLPLAGGSMTGNLTMSGTTEVIQATAPSTGSSLTNKDYVDNAVAGKVSKTGGNMTGNLSLTNSAEVIQAQAPTTASSLCNKTYVDDLYTTGNKASDMLVSIGTSASRAIGCGGVASRPTVAGDAKNIILSLGNSAISCVSSMIGVNPQVSSLALVSPGKTSFVNCVSNDSLPTETAKIEAVTLNGVTKGLMTVNGDIDLGPYKSFKVTNSADPVNANDLANKNYVDGRLPRLETSDETTSATLLSTDSAMSSIKIRNISTTMGTGGDVLIMSGMSAKTPINGKLIVLSVWLERTANEWFNVDNTTVIGSAYPNFQVIYNDGLKTLKLWWNGTHDAGWSGRARVNLLELP